MIKHFWQATFVALITSLMLASNSFAIDSQCPFGSTMTTTAHEDDSILFMSPDIAHDIQNGRCLRSVFVTSGSSGGSLIYMDQREEGAEAAYAVMANMPDNWSYRVVTEDNHFVTEAQLDGDPRITLDFMRLPNKMYGTEVWQTTKLAAVERGLDPNITTIDGPTTYTRVDLVNTLLDFMKRYHPDRIDTQDFVGHYGWGDHADHRATGFLTRSAWRIYNQGKLISYLGYNIGLQNPNVFGYWLNAKLTAWWAYAPHDSLVPQDEGSLNQSVYAGWLPAQYQLTQIEQSKRRVHNGLSSSMQNLPLAKRTAR